MVQTPWHTAFQTFLLNSTPYIPQTWIKITDTLLTIFKSLEEISDVGVEVYHNNPESKLSSWDVFIPTLKNISWIYKSNLLSTTHDSYCFNEEDELYQRVPFADKLEQLAEKDPKLFQCSLAWISDTSWIAIEWFLHYSSNRLGHGMQKSITMYYYLDFKRYNSFLPVIHWEVNDPTDKFWETYQISQHPCSWYQAFEVNSLIYN